MQALQGLKYTIVKACTGIQGKLHVCKVQVPAYMFQSESFPHVGNDHVRANIGREPVSCVHIPLSSIGKYYATVSRPSELG